MVGAGSWNIIEEISKIYWTGKAKHIEKIFVLLHFYHIECTYQGRNWRKQWPVSHQPIHFPPQLSIVYFIYLIITIADEQQLYSIQNPTSTNRYFSSPLHMTANKTGIINSLPLSSMTRGWGLRKEIYSNDLPPTFIHLWLHSSSF